MSLHVQPKACCSGSRALALGTVAGMAVCWLLMAELLQGMLDDSWNKPFFTVYVIHGGYALMIVPWAIMYWMRTRSGGAFSTARYGEFSVPWRQLIALSMFNQVLSAFTGYSWYLSLPNTLVAANNAIYQSSTAVVFVLSVLYIGERFTLRKLVAVCCCIVGVALVSFLGGSGGSSGNVTQTAGGYLWVIVSTIAYALYETINARFTEQVVRSWRDICSRSFKTRHAAEEHAEATCVSVDEDARGGADAHMHTGGGGDNGLDTTPSQTEPTDTLLAAKATTGMSVPEAPEELTPANAPPQLRAEVAAFMLGIMGLFTFVTLWPMFIILHHTGVEPFVWPPPDKGRMLGINTLIDSVFNVLLMFGIQISSPLMISVGTMTIIPAGVVADYIIHRATVGPIGVFGMLLIVLGWALLQLPDAWFRRLQPPCLRAAK